MSMWILPAGTYGTEDESWDIFKNESYIGIDYTFDDETVDYSSFNSQEEIEDYLSKNIGKRSYVPSIIWKFVNDFKIGDLVIIRKGASKLCGIGVISSDFIPQTKNNVKNKFGLNNIRYVNWILTPDDLFVGEKLFSRQNLVDLTKYSHLWNVLLCAISRYYDELKENILNFLYDGFNEFLNNKEGISYLIDYSNKSEDINNTWIEISNKYANDESISKDLWEKLFNFNIKIKKGEEISFKSILDSYNYSDEEINEIYVNVFEVLKSILSTNDFIEQKNILSEYSGSKYSNVFGIEILSHILHHLDNSFYIVDDNTIFTVNLLGLMFGEKIPIDYDLAHYIENNAEYKNFLEVLNQFYQYPNLDMSDFKIFYAFSHWMCGKNLGHFAAKRHYDDMKVNKLPINLLGNFEVSENTYSSNNSSKESRFESNIKRNLIYFGAPGTGKSYNLNKDMEKLTSNYERVTFHPDYSYANFVGTYKPVPKDKSISYEYVPGPFMRSLVKALKNPSESFLLIIEEINRANVAAVFGDVFQLLDRGSDNSSRYPIDATEDMKNYLKMELNEDFDKITIPSNLFIWATMNSADQGVFPMDTAFKRRWDFKYFGINHNEELVSNIKVELSNQVISWNDLRKAINEELLTYKINEDKLLGPFFAFNEYLNSEILLNEFKETFKNKIIMYLFEDAARSKRNDLFSGVSKKGNLTYSQICEAFDENGIEIFCENIKEKFITEEE